MLIRYFQGGNFLDAAFYNPDIDDFDFQVTSASSTQITGFNPGTGVVTTLTGTGFPAVPVPPLSGTLTGFSMVDAGGNALATVSGIAWGLQAALTAIEAAVGSSALELLAGLFSLQDITIDASDAVEGLFDLDLPGVTSDITVIGSDFADEIYGSDGDDRIDPGTAPVEADVPERIFASAGDDIFDFSNVPLDNSWTELVYDGLTGPITLNFNALTNTGTVEKGASQGTDTLVDVAGLMGLFSDVYGTTLGDDFTIRTVADTGLFLIGGRGGDSYTLTLAEGSTITLIFGYAFEGGATQGLVFNGATGVIANDGFGFAETLSLTRLGDVSGSTLQIRGTEFSDNIIGTAGRDTIRSDGGNDTLDGGAGFDRIRFDRPQYTAGVTVDLVANTATGTAQGAAFSHSLVRIEEVSGSQFADTIRGSGVAELLVGNRGADILDGRGGDDELEGGQGNDTMTGGTGSDRALYFDRASTDATIVLDADGNVVVTTGGETDLLIGVEALDFGDTAVTVQSLLTGAGGTGGNDVLRGSSANDSLRGQAGADRLDGRGGDDTMDGGLGNDTYFVDSAGDTIVNEVAFGAGGGIDTVFTTVNFTAPANVELVRAAAGAGNLALTGNDAPGTLVGNEGANTLNGRGGNDQINGNAGNDTIIGGEGADTLVGGTGADTFVFSSVSNSRPGVAARDVINGFTRAPGEQDRIDLSAIDANTGLGGLQDFTFIGSAAFTAAGQVRVQSLGGPNACIVEVNVNAGLAADMQIFVNLQTTMVATDFVL